MVQRGGMGRLLGKDLPVKALGLLQPPGLVVLQCKVEGLLDRELSHVVNGLSDVKESLATDGV
jgi:hypothetical protein